MIYIKVLLLLLLHDKYLCKQSDLNDIVFSGGPLHKSCDIVSDLWKSEHCDKNNLIAIKVLKYIDEIFVITPRLKCGVLATVWLIVQATSDVELEPYPKRASHKIADCQVIQNAVDAYLDPLGNMWILDSGLIDTTTNLPRCTCPPKVVCVNVLLRKLMKRIELTTIAEPISQLQNVVVEYNLAGMPFIYISDAARGALLVYNVNKEAGWQIVVCSPASGLQLAITKRGPVHSVLLITRIDQPGVFELDTGALKRKKECALKLRLFAEKTKPLVFLGFDNHNIYLRYSDSTDILRWDTDLPINSSHLNKVHTGSRLVPTSVYKDQLKHNILILESNYADAIYANIPAYHRISFVMQP